MADLRESIALCCKKLKLSSNLAEQAMTQEGATNQEYLYNLLCNEITYRKERRIMKLIAAAGFPRTYTREQFRTDEIDFPEDVSFGPCWIWISIAPEKTSSCTVGQGPEKQCCPF